MTETPTALPTPPLQPPPPPPPPQSLEDEGEHIDHHHHHHHHFQALKRKRMIMKVGADEIPETPDARRNGAAVAGAAGEGDGGARCQRLSRDFEGMKLGGSGMDVDGDGDGEGEGRGEKKKKKRRVAVNGFGSMIKGREEEEMVPRGGSVEEDKDKDKEGRGRSMQINGGMEETIIVLSPHDEAGMDGVQHDRTTVFSESCHEAGLGLGGDDGAKKQPNGNVRQRLKSPPPPITKEPDQDSFKCEEEDEDCDPGDPKQLGIGYKPTPSVQQMRSFKRMQQIKEYRVRESREAREKRTEQRRKRRSASASIAEASGTRGASRPGGHGAKVVHFNL